MNVTPLSRFGRLAIGLSRASVRQASSGTGSKRVTPPKPPGHGESVWIFNQLSTGQVVHSFSPVLKPNRALAQLPFNGKKTKPAKLRKDLWRPLAVVRFPAGLGFVGESVYQRLREFRRLHEISWGDELLFDEDGRPTTKHTRGKLLNNQKANAIADLAAVLGGAGGGSKMWRPVEGEEDEALRRRPRGAPKKVEDQEKALLDVEVYWDDDAMRNHAESWSPNVTHRLLKDMEPVEKPEIESKGTDGAAEATTEPESSPVAA